MVWGKATHGCRAALPTMTTATVHSLLSNFTHCSWSRWPTADNWPTLIDFVALNIRPIQAAAVLSLVYLYTWLSLRLIFVLI